jgi:hypothetical protein
VSHGSDSIRRLGNGDLETLALKCAKAMRNNCSCSRGDENPFKSQSAPYMDIGA